MRPGQCLLAPSLARGSAEDKFCNQSKICIISPVHPRAAAARKASAALAKRAWRQKLSSPRELREPRDDCTRMLHRVRGARPPSADHTAAKATPPAADPEICRKDLRVNLLIERRVVLNIFR